VIQRIKSDARLRNDLYSRLARGAARKRR
jgi:hypothetical protein